MRRDGRRWTVESKGEVDGRVAGADMTTYVCKVRSWHATGDDGGGLAQRVIAGRERGWGTAGPGLQ
jgi:hypothetical protein